LKPLLHHTKLTLLQQVAAGKEQAFRELYEQYRNQVFYFGCKFLKSPTEAEDVLQEVFSKIWINRTALPEINDFSKYLNTLTLNHIYSLLRRKACRESFLSKSIFATQPAMEAAFETVDLRSLEGLIQQAVVQLPPQQQKVFELSRMQGLKHEEIAQQLNISHETVKKHIMEALRNVRRYLADKGEIVVTSCLLILLLKIILI